MGHKTNRAQSNGAQKTPEPAHQAAYTPIYLSHQPKTNRALCEWYLNYCLIWEGQTRR
jgi:hypothetical protein